MTEESELYARSSARLGTTIRGKYRLDGVLGIGGMAVVFAATHRNLKRFAVKMLHAELSIREDIRTRFLREGYAANSLEHPGAVAVLDDDVAEDGSAFLVMELLEGAGLEELWEKSGQRMSPRVVLAVGHQLLDVLAAAHARGIVHRDIKPPNLFLMADGTVKVLDFGIARVRDAVASGGKHTGTGMLLGTPAFMAPEQALAVSSEITGQTDLWAVGATLFTLLSGELVHEGDNAPQLMIKAATTPARSLASVAPSTPAGVVQLVDRALAFDKVARWDSAEAMRDAIGETYASLFGEEVSRAPLASLFRASPGHLQTRHAGPTLPRSPSTPSRGVSASPPPRPAFAPSPSAHTIERPRPSAPGEPTTDTPFARSLPGRTLPIGTTPAGAYPQAPGIGMSTSKPVSSDALDEPAGLPGRRRTSRTLLAGLAIGSVAVIAFATFELGARTGAISSAATAPSESPSVAGVGTPRTGSSAGWAVVPSDPSSSAAQTITPSAVGLDAPVAQVSPVETTTKPVARLAPAGPTASAPRARAAPPATLGSSPIPHPICNPPYVIDSTGKHQYKLECL